MEDETGGKSWEGKEWGRWAKEIAELSDARELRDMIVSILECEEAGGSPFNPTGRREHDWTGTLRVRHLEIDEEWNPKGGELIYVPTDVEVIEGSCGMPQLPESGESEQRWQVMLRDKVEALGLRGGELMNFADAVATEAGIGWGRQRETFFRAVEVLSQLKGCVYKDEPSRELDTGLLSRVREQRESFEPTSKEERKAAGPLERAVMHIVYVMRCLDSIWRETKRPGGNETQDIIEDDEQAILEKAEQKGYLVITERDGQGRITKMRWTKKEVWLAYFLGVAFSSNSNDVWKRWTKRFFDGAEVEKKEKSLKSAYSRLINNKIVSDNKALVAIDEMINEVRNKKPFPR